MPSKTPRLISTNDTHPSADRQSRISAAMFAALEYSSNEHPSFSYGGPNHQLNVAISDPGLNTIESPASGVLAVNRVPYHQIFPLLILMVSYTKHPWIVAVVENGPKVIELVFETEPAGEAAAAA